MKKCSACGVEKPLSDFHKGSNYVDGVKSQCKICVLEWHKERHKQTYQSKKTPEKAEQKRLLAEKRKAELLILASERKAIADTFRPMFDAERKEREAAYRREYKKKWRKMNPGGRKVEKHNRKAKIKSLGRLSRGIAKKLFAFQKGKCAICHCDISGGFHLDHVVPIALNGTNTDDNVQLLCAKCNLSKGAKHPVDYMQSLGRLI